MQGWYKKMIRYPRFGLTCAFDGGRLHMSSTLSRCAVLKASTRAIAMTYLWHALLITLSRCNRAIRLARNSGSICGASICVVALHCLLQVLQHLDHHASKICMLRPNVTISMMARPYSGGHYTARYARLPILHNSDAYIRSAPCGVPSEAN